jgi:hypothetical protein
MWNYSEEIVEEEGDAADGKGEKKRTPEQGNMGGDKHDRKNEKAERAKTKSRRSNRELLSFSIEAPRKPRPTASIESDDVEVERSGTVTTAQSVVGNGTFWAGSTSNTTARQEVEHTEPAGKRLRVR